jgi:DNA-binding LacI/PurR family transcriptional regulator
MAKKRNITIRDIAEKAEVSTSTVSHVINNTRHVDTETRDRVLQVVRRLDYHPNIFAQNLRGKATKTLGIIISDIREDFFSEITKSIESHANDRGYAVILCDAEEDTQKEAFYLEMLLRKKVDGIIFAPVDPSSSGAAFLRKKIPVVQIDRKCERLEADFVGIDNMLSAETATSHLLDHGYRNLGFVGYNTIFSMTKRREGFFHAPEARAWDGARPLLTELLLDSRGQTQEEAVREWLGAPRGLEAILCGNSNICYIVLVALEALGLRVPDDIAVISFDDTIWFRFLKSPITAIRQPTRDLGNTALTLLCRRIEAEEKPSPADHLMKTDLIIRDSCGAHPQSTFDSGLLPGR